jgi:energy-coupling factor transporter ATP-binding protein EcfA2
MHYKLKPNQALVITGPQGCGKSRLARKIAEAYEAYSETSADDLTIKVLKTILLSSARTIVCEGIPVKPDILAQIKMLLSNRTIAVEVKPGEVKTVKVPHLIFCSGHVDTLPEMGERRFWVIDLGADK